MSTSEAERTARIRDLNDAFRTTFRGGKIVKTASVAALPDMVVAAALVSVAELRRIHRGQ